MGCNRAMHGVTRHEDEVARLDGTCLFADPKVTLAFEHDQQLFVVRLPVQAIGAGRAHDGGGHVLADGERLHRRRIGRCRSGDVLQDLSDVLKVAHERLLHYGWPQEKVAYKLYVTY